MINRILYATAVLTACQSIQAQANHKWEWHKPNGNATPAPSVKAQSAAGPAVEACYDFYARIGQTPPKVTPVVSSISSTDLLTVWFGPYGMFFYESSKGYIRSYHENMRPIQTYERARKKVPFKYPSTKEALIRIKHLAKQLGVPSNYSVVEAGQFDKRKPSKTMTGRADAAFEYLPYGYRLNQGGTTYRIRINPTDGMLLEFSQFKALAYVIESHTPKLTLRQAQKLAKPIAVQWGAGTVDPGEFHFKYGEKPKPPSRPSALRFVTPNGEMNGIKQDIKNKSWRLRLAWVIPYPREDQIWIDAETGQLLGGVNHRNHPCH